MADKKNETILAAAELIKKKFSAEGTGHDWHHMERVWRMAKKIGQAENADSFIVELAALFHDWADQKLSTDPAAETAAMKRWLKQNGVTKSQIDHICAIIDNVSFKGIDHQSKQSTIEGMVVQDADRLDAIGAIAIARVFAYGGHKGRLIYDPSVELNVPVSAAEYYTNDRSGIHHFFDKLLHLKGLINTKTGRAIAEQRHRYMERYLEQFFAEWEGRR